MGKGKGKRGAANHPEGDARGGKRLKAKDVLAELEQSAEFHAKRIQSESMTSVLAWTLIKSQLFEYFFYAMLLFSLCLPLTIVTVPAAVFGYKMRNTHRQEIEVRRLKAAGRHVCSSHTDSSNFERSHTQRLKAELDKLENDEDSILCQVKMLAMFLTDPAEFFNHPLIMERKLEAYFFGGRENFLSNFGVGLYI